MGKMVKGPWPELLYSIDEVRSITQRHWSEIAEMRKSLVHARKLFISGERIWPDQCNAVIELLEILSRPIKDFYEFLDKSVQLPPIVCPLRYPLIMILHRLDAQLSELRLLIATFRSISWMPSQQTFMLLEAIQQTLEMLFQTWKEVQWNVKLFLDQTESILQYD